MDMSTAPSTTAPHQQGVGERSGGYCASGTARRAVLGSWISTVLRTMSLGPGIWLPGRLTAAAPHASPSARAPAPSAPAARNPASRASPAPTELRGLSTGELPLTTPSAVTRTAP